MAVSVPAEDEKDQTIAGEVSALYQVEAGIQDREGLLREGGLW